MANDLRAHWEHVYQTRSPTAVSWYQSTPERSLAFIRASGLPLDAPLLDVGGGASTLVDHLLQDGHTDLTVLDISAAALAAARQRLGDAANRVHWLNAEITAFEPTRRYALWHDRAVFHFLVDAQLRDQYLDVLRRSLVPGGSLILATFGPEGPQRCSGLPVHRYTPAELNALLSPRFRLRDHALEEHRTPAGVTQQFLFTRWTLEN